MPKKGSSDLSIGGSIGGGNASGNNGNNAGAKIKRQISSYTAPPSKRCKHNSETTHHNTIMNLLKEYEGKAQVSADNIWLALQVTLQTLPLEHVLKQFGGATQQCMDKVPRLSRQYEEEHMRECAYQHDKHCNMGHACECNFIDSQHPFVGVALACNEHDMPNTGLCILCLRKATQFLFYRIVVGGLKSKNLLQLYGNYCGVPGEYHESAMLTIPPHGPVHCMPIPVVAHQRNRYQVQIRDDVKHLQQINVGFEDFQ